jgi:HSP20 family protein
MLYNTDNKKIRGGETYMTLVRYERPFGLLRDFFGEGFAAPVMKTDIKETEDSYIVEAEMPGVKKENVELVCEKGVLTIMAKANEEKTEEKDGYIRRERFPGGMTRRFELQDIDEEKISAKMDNGVLYITLPKKASEQEKRIEIE